METTALSRKRTGWPHAVTLVLLTYSLVGCAVPVSPQPKAVPPGASPAVIPKKAHVLITFQGPTKDNSQLSAAIAQACHCQPAFFRQYRENILIYIVTLAPGQTFADFEKSLMLQASGLGIKSIGQDSLEHI